MDLEELARYWDAFGKRDPLWAIMAWPGKEGGKWDVEEFFSTGIHDLEPIIQSAKLDSIDKALDFGCGVGRLSQAMSKHFKQVIGVDISPSMIELAEKYNKFGERCQYQVCNGLKHFQDNTFEFILTILVLQHIEPKYSKKYIRDFVRILKPGGKLVFQMPSEPIETIQQHDVLTPMEMYGIPKDEILKLLDHGNVLDIQDASNFTPGWKGFFYWVTK